MCSRGRANPNDLTVKRLFAASAGYCQKPDCTGRLFVDSGTEQAHIAEIAHIIAAGKAGPRSDSGVSRVDRGGFDNLILLCPHCHTMIDKMPRAFPASLVLGWKREHAQKLSRLFGTVEYEDRRGVRSALEPFLSENRAMFDQYGPHNEYRLNPESELATVWQRKVLAKIMPNNRMLLNILDVNRRHLNAEELAVVEIFRQHVDDLEARHIGSSERLPGVTFPPGMNALLLD